MTNSLSSPSLHYCSEDLDRDIFIDLVATGEMSKKEINTKSAASTPPESSTGDPKSVTVNNENSVNICNYGLIYKYITITLILWKISFNFFILSIIK